MRSSIDDSSSWTSISSRWPRSSLLPALAHSLLTSNPVSSDANDDERVPREAPGLSASCVKDRELGAGGVSGSCGSLPFPDITRASSSSPANPPVSRPSPSYTGPYPGGRFRRDRLEQ